ncbi:MULTISPECIES: hypothetical protein [unclassified Rickettsia]|uniref:hypothetical protein n=1 Tax=unclassified Rickettsia TaxID=114295 RepID=UPI003132E744
MPFFLFKSFIIIGKRRISARLKRSLRGGNGVVAWMVKNALGVIPAQAGIQRNT